MILIEIREDANIILDLYKSDGGISPFVQVKAAMNKTKLKEIRDWLDIVIKMCEE